MAAVDETVESGQHFRWVEVVVGTWTAVVEKGRQSLNRLFDDRMMMINYRRRMVDGSWVMWRREDETD